MTATLTQTQTQPDISYHPDFQKFQLRTERLKATRKADSSLPPGFPEQLTGPLVWEGEDFTDEKQWTFSLTEAHLEDIHNALQHFKCKITQPKCNLSSQKRKADDFYSTQQTHWPCLPVHFPAPNPHPSSPAPSTNPIHRPRILRAARSTGKFLHHLRKHHNLRRSLIPHRVHPWSSRQQARQRDETIVNAKSH